ncbi:FAD-binding oxidoreductase, partial [Rhodopirellula baltica]
MQRDIDSQRLHDDLRGLVSGDVLCDAVSTQLYASDASIYQIRPLAVVRPRSVADVSATVQYACENDLPIHPRGSGSGVSGESVGPGIVVD